MKTARIFIFILFLIVLSVYSCENNDNANVSYAYEAEVRGLNMDCGLYEIKITKGLEKVEDMIGLSPEEGVYIATNLPQNLEEPGLIILLDMRNPTSNELGMCSTMGLSYPWLYVTRTEKK
ncbi:hypothetical protein PbJCM13498_04190 [Prolixibacter bellariivorans]|uniref:Lipoprotein n=1 Tax=Prolixibacter bellariivorans TaxID=314319 RepID=A0A5M4AVF0_9BACT|nr:hypothetical protein [Prolixibacter bellariivorans]GET31556.1 hypothetical protein PbJCM13498_04190 [Prolixibacter bellariivorans]